MLKAYQILPKKEDSRRDNSHLERISQSKVRTTFLFKIRSQDLKKEDVVHLSIIKRKKIRM
jgi:hypothetical protein